MKSVYMEGPFNVCIKECPKPEAGQREVLIRVRAAGLCGTDLHTYKGINAMASYPLVPGHEIGGEVEALGSGVPEGLFSPGQRVTVKPYFNCGKCYSCLSGRVNCCESSRTLGVQISEGAFSEYVSIPYKNVISCGSLSYARMALIEPLCIGAHLAGRTAAEAGENIVVFGCGVIGLGAIAAAACKGANVLAVDIADNKLAIAREMGARYTVNSKTEPLEERIKATMGQVHVAIEAIGLPATMKMATEVVGNGGRIGYVGYGSGELALDSNMLIRKEVGIFTSRNALESDFHTVIANMQANTLPYEKLITATYPVEDGDRAFADWAADTDRFTKIQIVF